MSAGSGMIGALKLKEASEQKSVVDKCRSVILGQQQCSLHTVPFSPPPLAAPSLLFLISCEVSVESEGARQPSVQRERSELN